MLSPERTAHAVGEIISMVSDYTNRDLCLVQYVKERLLPFLLSPPKFTGRKDGSKTLSVS